MLAILQNAISSIFNRQLKTNTQVVLTAVWYTNHMHNNVTLKEKSYLVCVRETYLIPGSPDTFPCTPMYNIINS